MNNNSRTNPDISSNQQKSTTPFRRISDNIAEVIEPADITINVDTTENDISENSIISVEQNEELVNKKKKKRERNDDTSVPENDNSEEIM